MAVCLAVLAARRLILAALAPGLALVPVPDQGAAWLGQQAQLVHAAQGGAMGCQDVQAGLVRLVRPVLLAQG